LKGLLSRFKDQSSVKKKKEKIYFKKREREREGREKGVEEDWV